MKKLIIPILFVLLLVSLVSAPNPIIISNQQTTGFNATYGNTQIGINFFTFNPGSQIMPINSQNNPQLILNQTNSNIKFGLSISLPNIQWETKLVIQSNQKIIPSVIINGNNHEVFYIGTMNLKYDDLLLNYKVTEDLVNEYRLELTISGFQNKQAGQIVFLDPSLSPGLISTNYFWYFTKDTTAPTITLNSPNEGIILSPGTINFTFTTSDLTTITNCTLITNKIGNTSFALDNSIGSDGTYGIEQSLTEGTYTWGVQCSDSAGNLNIPSNRSLYLIAGSGTQQQGGSSGSGGFLTCPIGEHEDNGYCIPNTPEYIENITNISITGFEGEIEQKWEETKEIPVIGSITKGLEKVQQFLAENEMLGLILSGLIIIVAVPKRRGQKFGVFFFLGIFGLILTYFAVIKKGYINLINDIMLFVQNLIAKAHETIIYNSINANLSKVSLFFNEWILKLGGILPVSDPYFYGMIILIAGIIVVYFLLRSFNVTLGKVT